MILWFVCTAPKDSFPLCLKISVSIVISCCWLYDDVATVLAIMAAFFLYLYLRYNLRLGAEDYYMGVPIVELMCLVVLRFLVSIYWNVWISFSANIITLLVMAAHNIQRYGFNYVVKNDGISFVIVASPSILLLISFLLDDST